MLKSLRVKVVATLLLLLMFGLVLPVAAQDGGDSSDATADVSDDEVNEVAKEIYCPVCESTPLDVCATQACADWRELIRTQLGEGRTKQEVFDYFARQYGDGVLANPPQRGVSLVILWVLPIVLVLVGLLLFGRYVMTLRSQQKEGVPQVSLGGSATAVPPASRSASPDDYAARVEEELRKK